MVPRQQLHGDSKPIIVATSAVAAATIALLSIYAYSYFQRRRSCRAIMQQVSTVIKQKEISNSLKGHESQAFTISKK